MTQLPITSSTNPTPGKAANPASSAASPFSAEGGDGLEGAETPNFGTLLSKHIKGFAALLDKKGDMAPSDVAADLEASGLPIAAQDVAIVVPLPSDFAALQAAILALPGAPKPPADAADLYREAPKESAAELVWELPLAEQPEVSAEIADTGKSLPPVLVLGEQFSQKLARVGGPADGKPDLSVLTESTPALPQPVSGSVDTTSALRQPDARVMQQVLPRVGTAEWGGAMGDKVVWMASQNHQVAELHLNPPHLGPLEVRLTINNDQASALFVSHHSAVREAIETALPRLREMLADNGIMLGDVSVGAESFNQQQQAFDQKALAKGMAAGGPGGNAPIGITVQGNNLFAGGGRDGMVDIFA